MSKKHLIALIAPAAALIATSAAASDFPKPELTRISSDKIFAPPGFDDNDNAQIVVHGTLINTCYKAAQPLVEVDKAKRKITVEPQSYVYFSSWCLNVMVPYTQTVDLGVLPTGNYQIVELDRQGREVPRGTLPVGESKGAQPDDTLYAPVKNAMLDRKTSAPELILSGVLPTDCMYVQEVKTLRRTPGIIEVLPVAGYKQNTICQGTPRPFEARVALPAGDGSDTLIHIRSLNGQSINDVESL